MESDKTQDNSPKLSNAQQLDAICWAANQAGVTYGKFSVILGTAEKKQIFEEYAKLLAKKQREERQRLADFEYNSKRGSV